MIVRTWTEKWWMTRDGNVHRTEKRQVDGYNVETWDAGCTAACRRGGRWVVVPPPPGVKVLGW